MYPTETRGGQPKLSMKNGRIMMMPTTRDAALPTLTITPVNTAANSRGSIHDDEKAKEMGYKGGFIPGTTVLGYMSRLMQETYGPRWQAGSTFNGRLRRPLYEGAPATVTGAVIEEATAANGNTVTVELKVIDGEGTVVAFAEATCRV